MKFNTNAITKASLRGMQRRSNLKIRNEIATLLLVARNDNVITFNAFVLDLTSYYFGSYLKKGGVREAVYRFSP